MNLVTQIPMFGAEPLNLTIDSGSTVTITQKGIGTESDSEIVLTREEAAQLAVRLGEWLTWHEFRGSDGRLTPTRN